MKPFFTDSHAHIDYDSYDPDRDEMLQRCKEANVGKIFNISLGPEKSKWERALTLFQNEDHISVALGIHPHDASKADFESIPNLKKLLKNKKVKAVGEIGLDFFYNYSPRETQIKIFEELLDVALEFKLPVSIHSRDAFEDTYKATSKRNLFKKVGAVLHCFTGTVEEAKKFLEIGAYISFSGIITFKKAVELREVVKTVPLERLLIETDAPFLTPEPYRGKRNEPAFVVRVAETVASVKGITIDEVARATSQNAEKLFRL
jgi:TatD DNase family protein